MYKISRHSSTIQLCRLAQSLIPNKSGIFVFFRRVVGKEQASLGLARIGARAALSFAFAFLRRAWRSGEDSDLCQELLEEALEALQELPEATLFDETAVSPVWLEVVERATKFLKSVVAG